MTTLLPQLRTGRALLPAHLFDQLTARLADDRKVTIEYAARVVDQALAFIHTAAHTDERLTPSDAVDPGWHTFILDTAAYTRFCTTTFGFFVHHTPLLPDDPTAKGSAARATIERTVAAIRTAGFHIDDDLWKSAGRCSQCHSGCTDSPHHA